MPRFWPIPGKDIVTLLGEVLHVPLVAGYGHRCLHWPSVEVHNIEDLIGRRS